MTNTLLKLAAAAVVCFIVWRMLSPKYPIRIEMNSKGVHFHKGLPKARVGEILEFLEEQVKPTGRLTIYAGRQPNGYLQLKVSGRVAEGTRQQVRNFLITVL